MTSTVCRSCWAELTETFCDLGLSPMANSYVAPEELGRPEIFYPLHAYVCTDCLLVQLGEFETPEEIFSDYAYYSSYSSSWLEHAREYVEDVTHRFDIDSSTRVVEIASNDGYLLQYFQRDGVAVLGIEPAANVAEVARDKGIDTRVDFFGTKLAEKLVDEGVFADHLIGNNVLAHVPDLNDFVAGMKLLLSPGGRITMEFPHLLRLILHNQFDTIYHEHFSYFSLHSVTQVFERHGLRLFDVEEVSTHGGSLRIYACHAESDRYELTERLDALARKESHFALDRIEGYRDFAVAAARTKRELLSFLISARERGERVIAYGAPAKGNTLLNYCGVGQDLVECTVDRNPHKQGRHLPGTRLQIMDPEHIRTAKPDYVLILPWNLRGEIVRDLEFVGDWNGKFVIPIPHLEILSPEATDQ
ncbi:class I SAM-dependent methyltransferase [Gordonia sp. SL306]|uniref:class I SAM-dependent methyltransferase n=1 Tax=Gordonia sp. SL306 TaxID=2995145 RepID=UPI0022720C85|nr:class I SAM-dependent methyltransferase [Gordonia sp. SL306]WAC56760.1 class I SAM-dependent methyltransferase [Gordonia sp. SL306]